MIRLALDQKSLKFTLINLAKTADNIRAAEAAAVSIAGRQLEKAIKANMSVPAVGGTERSHREFLEGRDHPYAKRHPSIRNSAGSGFPGFGKPELTVYTVSGRLLRSINGVFDPNHRSSLLGSSQPAFTVSVDLSTAPHGRFIIQGTRVMHSRDILWQTSIDPAVSTLIRKTIVNVFGKVFRTKTGVRF